jgi:hypothetical protein
MSNHKGQAKISAGALLLIGILLIAIFYFFPVIVKIPTQQGGIITVQQTTTQTQAAGAYNIGFTYQEVNAMSSGSESTTSPSYVIYHSNGQRLSAVTTLYGTSGVSIASGATATKVSVLPNDGDFLFMKVYPGTAHYIDVAKFLAANPFVTSFKWIPTASATVNTLVAEIQISKIGVPNLNIDPSLSVQIQVPVLPHDTGLTLSSPADQDSIGTTAGTDVYITWEITGLTANSAFDFAHIVVTSNQTSALIELQDLKITTGSRIVNLATGADLGSTYTFTAPAATSQTSSGVTTYWRYFPANKANAVGVEEGLLIPRGSSDVDSIRLQLHVKTYFTAATDAATCVLSVRLISAGNALQTAVTDSVALGG